MKTIKIDHIGIAVKNISERLKLYRDFLGLKIAEEEEIPDRGIRICMLEVGDSRIELLESICQDSEISKFIEKKGEGIHHIAFEVKDIENVAQFAKENELRPLSETPQQGAGNSKVLFLHPKTAGGVLIELVQRKRKED